MSEHLPKFIVTISSADGEEIIYPSKYQNFSPYEDWGSYQRWLQKFLEEHYEEVGGVDVGGGVFVVVYRLKGGEE